MIKSLVATIYSALWSVKEGYYLRYSNIGWEWLPTQALLDEWIKNGEIG